MIARCLSIVLAAILAGWSGDAVSQAGTPSTTPATQPGTVALGAGTTQADKDFVQAYRQSSDGRRWMQMVYPRSAYKLGQEGDAIVRITFDRSGTILNEELLKSTGHSTLDQASLDAFHNADGLPPVPASLAPGVNTFSMVFPMTWSLGNQK